MEKNMGKLSDAAPYLAVAALAATGVGLAGVGAAGGTIAGTTAGAGALGAAGTQTGLALGTGAALAPEAAFLAGLGGTSPAVAPLATQAATTALAPQGGHFMGTQYGATGSFPEALQIGTGMEGVTSPTTPIGSHLDTSYAPIDAMTPKSNYAFMGRDMESAIPQWMDMSSNISPAVEEGTKTLMEKLGIDKKTAFQLASQFYAGSTEAPPNYQTAPPPTSTGRQYAYSSPNARQIMDRNRGWGRNIRRSSIT